MALLPRAHSIARLPLIVVYGVRLTLGSFDAINIIRNCHGSFELGSHVLGSAASRRTSAGIRKVFDPKYPFSRPVPLIPASSTTRLRLCDGLQTGLSHFLQVWTASIVDKDIAWRRFHIRPYIPGAMPNTHTD
ncbi:hypothetical protein B0H13DRAFT_2333395 [Mycena leptocephala]|nr:hypothetical protein B0H13DRAFT_2333395 [Mycena leptocephala]